jgi:hypothetical protein
VRLKVVLFVEDKPHLLRIEHEHRILETMVGIRIFGHKKVVYSKVLFVPFYRLILLEKAPNYYKSHSILMKTNFATLTPLPSYSVCAIPSVCDSTCCTME